MFRLSRQRCHVIMNQIAERIQCFACATCSAWRWLKQSENSGRDASWLRRDKSRESSMSDLWRRWASELAALIARKEVSSREVVEAHLARIATVNPKLNAIVKEARKGAD